MVRKSNTIRRPVTKANASSHSFGVDLNESRSSTSTENTENPPSEDGASPRNPGTSVWRLLDIEPVLILHLTAAMLVSVGTQDLLVVKACSVDLGIDEDACSSVRIKTPEEEQSIQKLLSSLIMWRTMISNFLPMIFVAQIGAWSDKHGRKLPMLMVTASFVLKFTFMACAAYFKDGISAWKTGLISSLIASSAGNNACFGMIVFSYIGDVTPKEKLSARISLNGSSYFLGILVGLVIGGYLTETSLPTIFILATTLELLVFISILLLIKRTAEDGTSTWWKLRDLFSPRYIIEAVSTVFKRRPGNKRLILWLLFTCHVVTLITFSGEASVEFLQTRLLYNWDAAAYSSYSMYRTVLGFIAKFLSMAVLTELLQLSDPAIGIFSCLCLIFSSLIQAFATNATLAYISALPTLLTGSLMAALRTLIYNTVDEREAGKVNSFIASLESMTPIIAAPIYTRVYSITFETFPGSFNLLTSILLTLPICIYTWVLYNQNVDVKTD